MPFPDGTSLENIFGEDLPSTLRNVVGRFTTEGVTSTPFTGGTQHGGTLRSAQTEPIELGFGELEIPGITAGTPFRLAIFDSPAGRWHLDIVLDGLSLKLDDLHGADLVPASATTPRRLIRKATDTAVVISGEATIRFQRAGDGQPVVVMFVDDRSAADPLANTGAVVSLRCTPPHFFFGTSEFAMTLSEILFDGSDSYSPEFIQNQGQDAAWKGFAIAEATFYAPPNALGRGGFSGGVRNLLIGSPRGVQGELELQWGRAPLDPATFVFRQDGGPGIGATGSGNALIVPITAGHDDLVEMDVSFVASNPPEGGAVTDWRASWRWPDGSETTGDTATGQVGHGQILRVTPEESVSGRPVVRHPEVTFRFVASGEVPEIDVTIGATTRTNVLHVAGPATDIAALTFTARSTAPSPGTFTWTLGEGGAPRTGTTITLPATDITGDTFLLLKERLGSGSVRQARLRVQAVAGQPLLIGSESGVINSAAPSVVLPLAAVEGTYDLPDFHARARYRPTLTTAALDGGVPARVAVPDGSLAIVTLETGGSAPVVEHDRHVELQFEFATGRALRWGPNRPVAVAAGGSEVDLHRQLLQWAGNYPGADFLVIGRCDDLGTDQLNADLALRRAKTARDFLTTLPPGSALTPVAAARITAWGEQTGQPSTVTTSPLDGEERAAQRLILATDASGAALVDRTGWPTDKRDTSHASEAVRLRYRRVDIYAVGGTPTAGAVRRTLDPGRAPDRRRMLVPGSPADPVPAITSTPEMDYRTRLFVAWDKPTGEGWKDLIPSKAEFEFAWSPDDHPLPSLGGQPVTMEVLTVYGSWAHDDATGFTRSQLGIRSDGDPDGLFKIEQANLVTALALGPMLLSGIDPSTDTVEKAGRITALAAAASLASVNMGTGPLVGAGSKAVFKSIEANGEVRDIAAPGEGYKVNLVSDYSTVLHVNAGALGLATAPDRPVKFRYKKVGIQFDSTKTDIWEQLAIAYPTDALEIEDPGRWVIDGVLGQLLRAVETALGTGSLWIETRFAFALSIGVVEISEAVIRVTFTDNTAPDFSLRGLVARIDIPATIKGEGRLRIEDPGGVIRAGLDIELIPLQLKASAAFAMAQITTPETFTFVSLFVKVQFPVGIPLGPSGAAIHGFVGQTAINGKRAIGGSTDIVRREIGWWTKTPETKYDPFNGQHALGVGAVVGTLPDASFSLSAQGMIVVAFPDPEVIFGVEVNLLSVPNRSAKESGGNQNAGIIGLIVIDDTAVSLAVSARYEIPEILTVVAPFSAYFPYSGNGVYVRIGADGQEGRSGEPVTLTLLPSTLNLRAFAYLMIEQNGLQRLGGNPDFSFDGFSIGFGAGAGLEWRAGPIRLSASALLLAGFGTDPLLIKAGIFVRGELTLLFISISARGQIVLTYQDDDVWLDGEFCGKVDLFFFSLEGCVNFRIGSPSAIVIAPPPPPVASVVLTDRGGRIMGEALPAGGTLLAQPIFRMAGVAGKTQNTGVDPKDNHTVWADTAPVINFRHFIKDSIPDGRQFNPDAQPSGARWFGSNRLKYAYRLDDVRLIKVSDGSVVSGTRPLDSAWITSPARQPGSSGPILPSGAEVQSLKLLDWEPWLWALPMADGGESAAGDPVKTIGDLCEVVPQPARACLYGRDARSAGQDRIRLLHETPPPGPYPSRFTLTGGPGLRAGGAVIDGAALAAIVADAGGLIVPGTVVDLAQPVAGAAGPITRGYRLPEAQVAAMGTVALTALPWLATLDRTVRRGTLLLKVCDGRSRSDDRQPGSCYSFAGLTIGRTYATLALPGYVLTAADPARKFAVADDVSLAQGSPVAGADRQPDIRIAAPGLVVEPSQSAQIIELHLFRTEAKPTLIDWTDQTGNRYQLTEPGNAKGAVTVRLVANAPIKSVTLSTKAKTLNLYRICTLGSDQGQRCFDFSGVSPNSLGRGPLVHAGITFTSVDPRIPLRLLDWVDGRANPARRGSDGTPELSFPQKGVELVPDRPWSSVSIGVFSNGTPVRAIALDDRGNVVAQTSDDAKEPVELDLSAPAIARVIVSGGSNEAVIYRICIGAATSERCISLATLKEGKSKKLEVEGILFTPLKNGETITVIDVATDSDPVVARRDGRVELRIPGAGLAVIPPSPVSAVKLTVMTLAGERAEARALDAAGNEIARASGGGAADALSVLTLEAPGIARVEIKAGRKSFLTRICTASKTDIERGQATAATLPRVTTRVGGRAQPWAATVIGAVTDTDGSLCRIVRYDQPGSVADAGSFDIVTPEGNRVTLLSLCAIDSLADLNRADDQAARTALRDTVAAAASGSIAATAREILLDRGERYRIEVDWSWQSWTSNAEGTDSPPQIPPDSPATPGGSDPWQTGTTQRFEFQIADEDLTTDETQDGLNEYRFDPRDLARYLSRTEPADGRDVVFTDDPLWVHFNTGHVEGLADRYGRELTLTVRRTDPPPQPDPASMALAVSPPLLATLRGKSPKSTLSLTEQRINDAVLAAPCLPDGPAVGGVSLGARFALEKLAMYDFNLIARRKGVPAAAQDPVVVNATRFVTSRYANPVEMLSSLGFETTVKAPIGPQELILADAATLPGGPLSVSDLDLGTALAAIGADTLPLPEGDGRVIALWRRRSDNSYGVAGFLIDSPEPLRRVGAVLQGQQAVDAIRCEPDRLTVGGTVFLPVRATLNWTRVLFVAATPVTPGTEAELQFRLNVAPGGAIIGRRVIQSRPVMLDTEGF